MSTEGEKPTTPPLTTEEDTMFDTTGMSERTINAIKDMRLDPNGPAPGGKAGFIRHEDGRILKVQFKRAATWVHCQTVPDDLSPKRVNNLVTNKAGRSPGISLGVFGPWIGWATETEYAAQFRRPFIPAKNGGSVVTVEDGGNTFIKGTRIKVGHSRFEDGFSVRLRAQYGDSAPTVISIGARGSYQEAVDHAVRRLAQREVSAAELHRSLNGCSV